jgi:hypothetical protein
MGFAKASAFVCIAISKNAKVRNSHKKAVIQSE